MNARTLLSSSRSCSSSNSSKPRKSEKGESASPRSSRSVMGVLLGRGWLSGTLLVEALLIEKRIDVRGQLVGLGEDPEVAAAVDDEPGRRDQLGLHPRVDDRDDRVVVAPHHQ